jgi:hypothetical protein
MKHKRKTTSKNIYFEEFSRKSVYFIEIPKIDDVFSKGKSKSDKDTKQNDFFCIFYRREISRKKMKMFACFFDKSNNEIVENNELKTIKYKISIIDSLF